MNTLNKFFPLLFLLLLLVPVTSKAQSEYDVLRYSTIYYEGTARSLALGNAFTALGGDMGAISINPASSGVYRSQEVQFTASLYNSIDKVNYLGNDLTERGAKAGYSNFGYVGSFKTGNVRQGLINWNFAVLANKVNNYNTRSYASGLEEKTSWLSSMAEHSDGILSNDFNSSSGYDPYRNSSIPWSSLLAWDTYLLDPYPGSNYSYVGATENIEGTQIYVGGPLRQRYRSETAGGISELLFNFGANISNKLFFGVNITALSMNYSLWETYSEIARNSDHFETGFQEFTHTYELNTSGTGFNLKAGVIFLPVKGLRLGASITTPTWFTIDERWAESMESSFIGDRYSANSPTGLNSWKMTTPLRLNLGIAYVIGSSALLSVDYENVNYTTMRSRDIDNYDFDDINKNIEDNFRTTHNLRAGLEVKATPHLSIRGGYNYYDSPEIHFDAQRHYASLGFGFKANNGFFIDVAYQRKINYTEYEFTLYDNYGTSTNPIYAPVLTSNTSDWKVLLTVGFKF